MAQSLVIPLAIPLCQFLLSLESLLLTWNPSSCVVRSRPPWSQVACKLTSPSPFPPHFLPILISQPPRGFPKSIVRPSKTTSRSRLHIVWNMYMWSLLPCILRIHAVPIPHILFWYIHSLFPCIRPAYAVPTYLNSFHICASPAPVFFLKEF
jgi:hypothetical protein